MNVTELLLLISRRPYLTRADLAIRFGVHPHTIDRWRREGFFNVPAVRVRGPRWRPDQVVEWHERNADAIRVLNGGQ